MNESRRSGGYLPFRRNRISSFLALAARETRNPMFLPETFSFELEDWHPPRRSPIGETGQI